MVSTTTITRTGVRLQLVALEMLSINDRSVRQGLLADIINECVPSGMLACFILWGRRGDQALARMDVAIDYDHHEKLVRLGGDAIPEELRGEYRGELGPAGSFSANPALRKHCPHMGKVIDLFCNLLRQKGLDLAWTVQFRDRADEMQRKFSLVPLSFTDQTAGAAANTVTDSLFPELSAKTVFSDQFFAPSGGH
jgi:hypothetical protein